MDHAVENASSYISRDSEYSAEKLVLHFKSVIRRRARQQSAKWSREIQYGSLTDMETSYIACSCARPWPARVRDARLETAKSCHEVSDLAGRRGFAGFKVTLNA
jgi:hypothetical protein